MSESGAVGLYHPPEGTQEGEYVLMADGKYYPKCVAHSLALERAIEEMNGEPKTRQEHYEAMSEDYVNDDEFVPECEEKHLACAMGNKPCPDCGNDAWVCDGVGDVNSDEKGSGARYNAGKPPMAYIPFRQQFIVLRGYDSFCQRPDLMQLVEDLDRFERREIEAEAILERLEITDLHAASYVWDYGAKKYAAFNWAKGMQWSIPLACISRHLQAMTVFGEELDEESGCTHWGHIVCNLLMLEHFEKYYTEGDDRPPASVF